MATNIWSSAGSTDNNIGANWSLGHVPDATEDVLFDATSIVACTFTANLLCKTFTTTVGYNAVIRYDSFSIISVGTITIGHPGNAPGAGWAGSFIGWGGSIVITGDGDLIVTDANPICSTTDMRGTGSAIFTTGSTFYGNITCAYPGKTTTFSSIAYTLTVDAKLIGMGGTIIADRPFTYYSPLGPGPANPLFDLTTNPTIFIGDINMVTPNTGGPIVFPSINIKGTITFQSNSPYLLKISGNIFADNFIIPNRFGTVEMIEGSTISTSGDFTILTTGLEMNDADMNISGNLTLGYPIWEGSSWATGNYSLDSSTWNVGGNWTVLSGIIVDPGTSLVTFSGNTPIITSRWQPFYNVTMSITGPSSSFNDGCLFNRLIVTKGKSYTFESGETFEFTTVAGGDWDGISTAQRTSFLASTPGVPVEFTVPEGITVQYMGVTDNHASEIIDATTGCDDGLGNENWVFTLVDGSALLLPNSNRRGRY